jgi:hypothetical protein
VQELATGHAVVVFLNLGQAMNPVWHSAVLVGHHRESREFTMRSGPVERDVFSWRTFEFTWARGGHWTAVVLSPGRLPATAAITDAVDAAVGFERVAAPADAARNLPGAAAARNNLARVRWALGELEAAGHAARRWRR